MTAPLVGGPRGRVLVLSVCLTLLVAVCGREAWTNYEARRFNQLVEAIVVRDEPTSVYQAVPRPTGRREQNAAQHYVAAAELLVTRPEWDTANGALLAAARAGDLGDDDTRLRNAAFVQANAEALRLLARARTLTFHGFNVPLRFRYVPTPTSRLPGLLGAGALERIQQGDGDASLNLVADLLATLRIDEATNRVTPYRASVLDQAAVLVSLTVRHAPPSEAALRTLAAALAATAPDDSLALYFMSERARFIGQVSWHLGGGQPLTDANPVVAFLVRPWLRRRVNRNLELFGRLVAATEQPWPERLAAVDAVVEHAARRTVRTGRLGTLGALERTFAAGHFPRTTRYVAQRMAVTAVLRAVTGVELYRIERGTLPARLDDLGAVSGFRDPMTGDTLRYRPDTDGYVVYSVGSDGTDHDGDFGALSPYSVWWLVAPDQEPDWGIRIRLPDAP